MASGDVLFTFDALSLHTPTSNFATHGMVGSTTNEPVVVFDAANEEAYGEGHVPDYYNGGGLTIDLYYSSDATSGNVTWEVSFDKRGSGDSVASPSYGTAKTATQAVPATADQIAKATITFTAAEIDGLAADTPFQVKVRLTSTPPPKVRLHALVVKET